MKFLRALALLLFIVSPALADGPSWGIATTSTPGVVQPDGSTITITGAGVISSSGSGSSKVLQSITGPNIGVTYTQNGNGTTNAGLTIGEAVRYDVTNGSSAAIINAVLASNVTNGLVSFQPGTYNLTAGIVTTNGGQLMGNGCWLVPTPSLAGPTLDTTTNLGKPITIDGFNFNGGVVEAYNTSAYYDSTHLIPNGFFGDIYWSNQMALRVEASGGATVRNCSFTGYSGEAILALNAGANTILTLPRLVITHNRFLTNFCGVCLPGSQFEVQGYNNNPSAGQVHNEPAYSVVIENQFIGDQVSVIDDEANEQILDNLCLSEYMAICQNSLGGAALVEGNVMNHGTYGIFNVSPSGFPQIIGNTFLADSTATIMCDAGAAVDFEHNLFGNALIFTNGSTGFILHNRFFPGDSWGTGNELTNIDAGMVIGDNIDQSGVNSDGSQLASLIQTNAIRTNRAPFNVVSNFTPNVSQLYTNNELCRVFFDGSIALTAGGTASANSEAVTVNITNNGVGWLKQLQLGPVSQPFTNEVIQQLNFHLGPGDTFKVTAVATGGSSSAAFNPSVFIAQ